MKKPVYTILYSLFVAVVFCGTALTVQSCGKKKEEEQSANDQLESLADEHTSESFFEEGDESYDGDGTDYDAGSTTSSYETKEDPGSVDYTAAPTTSSTPSSSTSSSSYQTPTQTQSYSSSSAPFLVIAGNYLVENNADEMVAKLNQRGYSAEKVVFDLSQYYTVLAGRYDSRGAAQRTSDALKGAGIDNYVMRKK